MTPTTPPTERHVRGRATRNMDRMPLRKDGNMIHVDTAHVFQSDKDAAPGTRHLQRSDNPGYRRYLPEFARKPQAVRQATAPRGGTDRRRARIRPIRRRRWRAASQAHHRSLRMTRDCRYLDFGVRRIADRLRPRREAHDREAG